MIPFFVEVASVVEGTRPVDYLFTGWFQLHFFFGAELAI